MKKIKIADKEFVLFIQYKNILHRVKYIAEKINEDLSTEEVYFIAILNGAFMFASDLLKHIHFPCRISFLKLISYQGTESSGNVKQLIGINEDINDKTVVVLEDIIDSGLTIKSVTDQLLVFNPKKIKICSMFFKPGPYKGNHVIDYCGMEIPDKFIIGYGLDYNGYGRNLQDVYVLK